MGAEYDLATSVGRIAYLASRNGAENYLEIGVQNGNTFFDVQFPRKVAVDPRFGFDSAGRAGPGTFFCPMTSDAFFDSLRAGTQFCDGAGVPLPAPPVFDIIFIDGLHTFEQSFRDFENSLPFSHEKTFWLIDDTFPCDPFSALPDLRLAFQMRRFLGLPGGPWHGDVYKTILAIHDMYPEFCYCTLTDGNAQTLVWRTDTRREARHFYSLKAINSVTYFDLLELMALMVPIPEEYLSEFLDKNFSG